MEAFLKKRRILLDALDSCRLCSSGDSTGITSVFQKKKKKRILMEALDCCSSGDSTGITSLPSHIITSHILTKLDAPSLASISCSSRQLYALCLEENLWKNICNYTFPSTTNPLVRNMISEFPSGHRSFYFDTFPTHPPYEHSKIKIKNEQGGAAQELIYAVDVKFGDSFLYSEVVVTSWPAEYGFVPIPLKVEFKQRIQVAEDLRSQVMKNLEEKLKISLILIDPIRKKAINLSSHASGLLHVEYTVEVAGRDVGYMVAVGLGCKGRELCVHDIIIKPKCISTEGKGGIFFVKLQEAMQCKRCGKRKDEEDDLLKKKKKREKCVDRGSFSNAPKLKVQHDEENNRGSFSDAPKLQLQRGHQPKRRRLRFP